MTTAKAVKSTFDFIVIGAGAAGEAAGHEARRLGASVAVVERELVGGSCPFWACMPSKALLHAAAIHALGGDYPWSRASGFRDWMINRENRDWPDDSSHVTSLAKAGAWSSAERGGSWDRLGQRRSCQRTRRIDRYRPGEERGTEVHRLDGRNSRDVSHPTVVPPCGPANAAADQPLRPATGPIRRTRVPRNTR